MDFTTFKIAWRNIWRNKLRSSVVISAITVGLFGGLAATGIMKGMVVNMLKTSIETRISNIQLHHKSFLADKEVKFFIENSSEIIDEINQNDKVIAACQRSKSFGMASTASKGLGVMINGIEPEKEKLVTKIYTKQIDSLGTYFKSDKRNRILISQRLAKKLNVKIKSKIVITFQDYDGNLTGSPFKVEGIYKTQHSQFDEMNVFVKISDLDRLLNLPKNVSHEIAVLLHNNDDTPIVIDEIRKAQSDIDVQAWYKIEPYLEMASSMTRFMLLIFMSIILLALGFAIVNTMLMVVLERTKELGMIMAIGMNRKKVFQMIMFETTMLTIVGGAFGIIITLVFTWYYGNVGISIASVGEGFEAVGYSSTMYPFLELSDYIEVIILVMITGVIASIFPTIRALKMKPAEAVRD